jgi:hypothetical protein
MRGQRREAGWRWVVKERIEEISERRHRRQEGRPWREDMHTSLLVPPLSSPLTLPVIRPEPNPMKSR